MTLDEMVNDTRVYLIGFDSKIISSEAAAYAKQFYPEFADEIVAKLDLPKLAQAASSGEQDDVARTLNILSTDIYLNNVAAGCYTDIKTGLRYNRNIPEMLMLIVSEISEGMEGYRKSLPDDKLPHRSMFEVELADAVIRICDLAGYLNLDLGGAVQEKRAYNASRADHKIENRQGVEGKKF